MLIGLCAAWPFRQTYSRIPAPKSAAAPLELTLRRPDAPLELAPRTDISPAVGLESIAGQSPSSAGRSLTSLKTTDLANLAPPPALPVSFQPTTASPSSNDWRPEPVVRATKPQGKPRPYRIRDGDTLERIAERLLGNRERATEIFEANREVLNRPDLLPVGVTIMLPPREQPDDLEPVNR
jgi:nucleoid-associated protein YgaU